MQPSAGECWAAPTMAACLCRHSLAVAAAHACQHAPPLWGSQLAQPCRATWHVRLAQTCPAHGCAPRAAARARTSGRRHVRTLGWPSLPPACSLQDPLLAPAPLCVCSGKRAACIWPLLSKGRLPRCTQACAAEVVAAANAAGERIAAKTTMRVWWEVLRAAPFQLIPPSRCAVHARPCPQRSLPPRLGVRGSLPRVTSPPSSPRKLLLPPLPPLLLLLMHQPASSRMQGGPQDHL